MTEVYKKKTPREHILERPNMYIGASNEIETEDYCYTEGKIQKAKIKYIPGLTKIINEIVDNSVDIAIKTEFKGCNLVNVKITDDEVYVEDNGPGIPVKKNAEGEYLPLVCWGYAMSGSNFDDDDNRTHLGMNGVGAFCTNVWSTEFTGISDDGEHRYTVKFKDNASRFKESVQDSKEKGVTVKFTPDLNRFKTSKIDQTHKDLIFQRLINLSVCFPEIQFKFNGKIVKTKNFKNYVEMFSDTFEVYQDKNYSFAVIPSPSDEFQSFSYLNGLNIKDGGTHIDVIVNSLVQELRETLTRKYKTLKPADIKNKLMIVGIFTGFTNPKFNSQTKEKLTNSISEVNQYLGNIDYKAMAKKILKNSSIVDPIVEVFKIKEELKNRQELKTLNKAKRIKDEHYLPAIKDNKYLMIVEGFSASSGLVPSFGRECYGYYCLKGKPLNVWTVSQSKFASNKELSTLYKIIKSSGTEEDMKDGVFYRVVVNGKTLIVNENDTVKINGKWVDSKALGLSEQFSPSHNELKEYRTQTDVKRKKALIGGYSKIIFASDQDLDGFHIRALLSGFIRKYLPEYLDRVGMLETPIMGFLKSGKLQRWCYTLDEAKPRQGETAFYYKGLGSWEKEDLKKVIKTDGIEKMVKMLGFDSEFADNALEEWLGDDSEPRKKHILNNEFNIAEV